MLILVLLFVGGAVAGTLGFVEVLESLEAGLAQALAVPESEQARRGHRRADALARSSCACSAG